MVDWLSAGFLDYGLSPEDLLYVGALYADLNLVPTNYRHPLFYKV